MKVNIRKRYLFVCLILTFVWNALHTVEAGIKVYSYWTMAYGQYMTEVSSPYSRQMTVLLAQAFITLGGDIVIAALAFIGIIVLAKMKEAQTEDT